jgi:hypothetical protein
MITHPHHPLHGQRLPIVGLRQSERPDVIVRLPDGSHVAVALDATDYPSNASATSPIIGAKHLLDLQGLHQMAQFIDGLRQQGLFPSPAC